MADGGGAERRQGLEWDSGIRNGWREGNRWEGFAGAWRGLLVLESSLSPVLRDQVCSFLSGPCWGRGFSVDSLVGVKAPVLVPQASVTQHTSQEAQSNRPVPTQSWGLEVCSQNVSSAILLLRLWAEPFLPLPAPGGGWQSCCSLVRSCIPPVSACQHVATFSSCVSVFTFPVRIRHVRSGPTLTTSS